MSSIDLDMYANMITAVNKIVDNSTMFSGFRENSDTYFSTASVYFENYIQEYNVSEIYEMREALQRLWDNNNLYYSLIPSVLYLCNKMKEDEEQRFTGIDLVNYMM